MIASREDTSVNDITILIVNNELANLRFLRQILRQHHYHVRVATSAEETFQEIARETPHLILLDFTTPYMNGYDICLQLKSDNVTSDIPIITISSHTNKHEISRILDLGNVDSIAKPFHTSELVSRVSLHINIRLQQREIAALRQRDATLVTRLHKEVEQRKTAEQSLIKANKHFRLISQLISSTSVTSAPMKVLDDICNQVLKQYKANCAFALVNVQGKQKLRIPPTCGDEYQSRFQNINFSTILDQLKHYFSVSDSPYVSGDMQHDSILVSLSNFTVGYMQSALVIPMRVRETVLGVMFICHAQLHTFTQDEISLGGEVGRAAAQALENCLLHQQLTEHNKRLENMVTDRTAQLDRLNRRMAAILENVTDVIIVANDDGTIDMTNASFMEHFGYLPDELFSYPLHEVFHPEHQEVVIQAFKHTLAGDNQTHIFVRALHKDGSVLDLDMSFAQAYDDENHVVCTCHDITHLKEAERIKDDFISMVTHELRTPIATILLIADAFQKYYRRMSETQILNKIDQLHTQSRTMAELVDSVLDISRLEARPQQGKLESVEMSDIVHQVVNELQTKAQMKHQILRIEQTQLSVSISGDPVDFSRIWRNLIGNAIKYTSDGGEIHIRLGVLHIAGDKSVVSSPSWYKSQNLHVKKPEEAIYCVGQVEDNGYGIVPEDIPFIYERFYRGWAKQTNIPGTGLGLSLVRDLLILYDGDMHVASLPSIGTTFTFWIPLTENNSN